PWKLAKDPASRGRLAAVLAIAYEGLRHLVLLVAPAMPESARHIWRQMGLAGDPLKISPNAVTWGEGVEVAKIEQISPAFPKLNKEKIMAEIEQQNEAAPAAAQPEADATPAVAPAQPEAPSQGATQAAAPPTNVISIDDFIKVELRAATVLEAERVP